MYSGNTSVLAWDKNLGIREVSYEKKQDYRSPKALGDILVRSLHWESRGLDPYTVID